MKRIFFIILAIILIFPGCTKKEPARTTGIDTIDNTIYQATSYFVYGFSFSGAKLISTTSNPGPDIVLYVNSDNLTPRLTLQSNNLKPSFYKYGEFADEEAAKLAFSNLKTFTATLWSDMADPINANQIWLYRSGSENYTKIRIISTINEIRNNIAYGECKFEWLYQPDGSSNFPGK
jgi:hypothetical protein